MMWVLLATFTLGTLVGASAVILYSFVLFNENIRKKLTQATDKAAAESTKRDIRNDLEGMSTAQKELVLNKLREAAEIARMQMEMIAQIDMPSKNALHSKHKNMLRHDIQELETKKMGILHEILKEGVDPAITILNDQGQPEEMLLSKYLDANQPKPAAPDPTAPRAIGKFTLVKGGKDNGKGN